MPVERKDRLAVIAVIANAQDDQVAIEVQLRAILDGGIAARVFNRAIGNRDDRSAFGIAEFHACMGPILATCGRAIGIGAISPIYVVVREGAAYDIVIRRKAIVRGGRRRRITGSGWRGRG